MTLTQMKEALSMGKTPDYFEEIYPKVKDEYEERSAFILSDAYIENILESASALLPYINLIKEAAAKIRENYAMRLFICILERRVKTGEKPNTADYEAPCGDGIEYDFLHLFPALPTIPDSVSFFKNRGVPEDIIVSSIREYDFCVNLCIKNLGRPAFTVDRLAWITRVINNDIIRIGRFKYEMPCKRLDGVKVYKSKSGNLTLLAYNTNIHTSGRILGTAGLDDSGSFRAEISETDTELKGYPVLDGLVSQNSVTLKKSEWELCLSPEDDVIPVHIPPDESFDHDICEASYERAREIFDTCFPDKKYKAFHCRTWLLSIDLKKVLKPSSNILDFNKKYTIYPTKSKGDWIFENVFPGQGGISNLENLSENTSLQREVKRLYLSGDHICEASGFFI